MKEKEQEFLNRIESHKGILYKVSKMYMDNYDDQQDLFQEIVCQLWKSYDTFRNESQFSTWMYRVAVNTAIVFLRKEKRKVDKYEIASENIKDDEGDSHIKESQLDHFYKAVQKLEKIDKAIIFYQLEGFSHKEIGENLGISEGNARVKLNRAKEKLKEIIKNQGYGF
ncbi:MULTISPECIES: RNA polymerase sigma factor [Flavobacterium]|uniref:RNA polymerase sigma-70 factor, ECF subfamily n=3 Tax=Flavobacterium TaxID=237 RepID=A0A521E5U8_9FLAO|nr:MULTISPECIES: RNA polymerase sigma factor [Flavobacterium]KAF2335527.1 RNA polymerase sigma factor [Flavobacterium daemonense]MDQ6471263.1 RNA polymerase sigma factor [Flavobacterium sp. LHD-80]MRX69169.1 sigma-70 family RNA polymerase sigma factor [Flavobacterium resistens]MTH18041.1 sigma-70 family RNA polymerase sigma factor [Flavobacterium sp. LC2016-01]TDO95463.1 RNA polymerase sigma-70 factor (ECF subfamily) [Flavobacterium sp. 245]